MQHSHTRELKYIQALKNAQFMKMTRMENLKLVLKC